MQGRKVKYFAWLNYREKNINAVIQSPLYVVLFFQQLRGEMSQGQNHLEDSSLEFHKLLRIIQGAFHHATLIR